MSSADLIPNAGIEPLSSGNAGYSDDKDWFLQSIIGLADLGLEIGITLTLSGSIMSGTLISGRTYFKEIAKKVKGADGGVTLGGENILEDIANFWEGYSSLYDRPADAGEDYVKPPAGYIHLRSAFSFSPSGDRLPSNGEGPLWRGRLASVSGFSLGSLSSS
jgi:hypothetical protein